jgi:hypothetical protein
MRAIKPTCKDYRQEMVLLAMRRRLARPDTPEAEKERIRAEIRRLEDLLEMA